MGKYTAVTLPNVTGNRNREAGEVVKGRALAVLSASFHELPRRYSLLALANRPAAVAVEVVSGQVNCSVRKPELAQPSKSAQCDLLISRSHCNGIRYFLRAVGGAARD